MNPQQVRRERLRQLTDLPNIGESMAADLCLIGIHTPQQLAGKDPFELYEHLCDVTQVHQDPCVLDTFLSIVSFVDGGPALPWWNFTAIRKQALQARGES
ncbi:MAG: helix-hairpin-helix domain-containing protein [Xanthomonadaceae bacterium]|jgi:hypothetical protein|nr:helix-hairpin-helix domain-containing protein [Xanthomonadaceae bacterium]